MPNQFVILAYPRTGSYNLMSLLDSCDDIACYGELFKVKRMEVPKFRLNKLPFKTTEERDANPKRFLTALSKQTPRKHFGFKLFQWHLVNVAHLEDILRDWKWVILFRDPIETYASTLRAQNTNIWTKRTGHDVDDAVLNQPVRFTPESLSSFAAVYSVYFRRCHEIAAASPSFTLAYDQMNDRTTMSALLDFLGSQSSAESMQSTYQKQFTRPLQEGFENWEEMQAYLAANDLFGPTPETTIKGI